MAAKKKITLNRKKKEPEVEVKEVTLEEALDEIEDKTIPETEGNPITDVIEEENPIETAIESKMESEQQVMFTRSQLKGEIVGHGNHTAVVKPKGRIKFEAQYSAVPLFKLPEEIRRYLVSHSLPTTVWQWDKEKLEKRNVDMGMVEKLKKFLSSMS